MAETVKVKVVYKSAGFRKILRSQAAVADVARRGRAIERAAGEGFTTETKVGPNRARATVMAAAYDARKAEAEDKVLTRAIGAGRG